MASLAFLNLSSGETWRGVLNATVRSAVIAPTRMAPGDVS